MPGSADGRAAATVSGGLPPGDLGVAAGASGASARALRQWWVCMLWAVGCGLFRRSCWPRSPGEQQWSPALWVASVTLLGARGLGGLRLVWHGTAAPCGWHSAVGERIATRIFRPRLLEASWLSGLAGGARSVCFASWLKHSAGRHSRRRCGRACQKPGVLPDPCGAHHAQETLDARWPLTRA